MKNLGLSKPPRQKNISLHALAMRFYALRPLLLYRYRRLYKLCNLQVSVLDSKRDGSETQKKYVPTYTGAMVSRINRFGLKEE